MSFVLHLALLRLRSSATRWIQRQANKDNYALSELIVASGPLIDEASNFWPAPVRSDASQPFPVWLLGTLFTHISNGFT
jgi:hypothetical protein